MAFLSTLSLLMARVSANHPDHALAADDFALVADLLDAGADLHDALSFGSKLLQYLSSAGVDGREADADAVTLNEADDSVAG
jgi:hypothetical protein